MTSGNLVFVGRIVGVFGIKGDIKLHSYTHNPFDIATYGKLYTKDGQEFSIKILRIAKGSTLIARIEGCNTRDMAEAYKGKELYISRSSLPMLSGDEYYLSDLEGLNVLNEKNDILGRVQSVHNFGAGDFLEIVLSSGKIATLPFNKDAVILVSDEDNKIVISESFLIY
jgi:16S rRNA processing protein RimM